MVDESIVKSAQKYLRAVNKSGIPVSFGVVFGSQVNGTAHKWSDIDLLVISPRFDGEIKHKDVALLWRTIVATDSRIEPIAVGERQWEEDDSSAIIEIARREGKTIRCP